jgi:hypothetical protein
MGKLDKRVLFRVNSEDYEAWREDARGRGMNMQEWGRAAMNLFAGRSVRIAGGEVILKPTGERVAAPVSVRLGFDPEAERQRARDLAAVTGKCTADVERGVRCRLCQKIH